MPFYRFFVHGADSRAPDGARGFFTTRHAFARDQDQAATKVLAKLEREFTTGASAVLWDSDAPVMTIEKGWRIGLLQLLSAPNRGSSFYDETIVAED